MLARRLRRQKLEQHCKEQAGDTPYDLTFKSTTTSGKSLSSDVQEVQGQVDSLLNVFTLSMQLK